MTRASHECSVQVSQLVRRVREEPYDDVSVDKAWCWHEVFWDGLQEAVMDGRPVGSELNCNRP